MRKVRHWGDKWPQVSFRYLKLAARFCLVAVFNIRKHFRRQFSTIAMRNAKGLGIGSAKHQRNPEQYALEYYTTPFRAFAAQTDTYCLP